MRQTTKEFRSIRTRKNAVASVDDGAFGGRNHGGGGLQLFVVRDGRGGPRGRYR